MNPMFLLLDGGKGMGFFGVQYDFSQVSTSAEKFLAMEP